jgi:hypothetical protein
VEKSAKTPSPSDLWSAPLAFFERGVEELAKMQARSAEQVSKAVDESARLAKAMIEQSSRLQAEWLRLGTEAARRGAEALERHG